MTTYLRGEPEALPQENKGKPDEKRKVEEDEAWEDDDAFAEDFEETPLDVAGEEDPELEFEDEDADKQEFQNDDPKEQPEKTPVAKPKPKEEGATDDPVKQEAREKLENELGEDEEEEEEIPEYIMDMEELEKPGWLIPHFSVKKYDPKAKSTSGHKRVWAIDLCRKLHMNMDQKGKVKKTHQAPKLLMIEKNIMHHNRAKLMFFDANHAYEMVFQHGTDRERFYECTSAIRPFRIWCDDLCKDLGDDSNTVINCKGQKVKVDLDGQMQEKECEEEAEIFASKTPFERVKLWTGTLNLDGKTPPSFDQMEKWMPRGEYDLYAVSVQDAGYREDENEFYRYIAKYLGKSYLIIAQMTVWDCLLCVVARKRILTRLANIEGSTKATKDHVHLDYRGGCAISLKYHETSMCFLGIHLPDPVTSNKQRMTVWNEIWDDLRVANMWTDLTQQFHHIFVLGCMNYHVELPFDDALAFIEAKDYAPLLEKDQLKDQRSDEGILAGFEEHPITFRPTSFVQRGKSAEYLKASAKKDIRTPSYTDRILWKNNPTAWFFECTGYRSVPEVMTSNHTPVSATFEIDCQRPFISIFGHDVRGTKYIFDFVKADMKGQVLKSPLLQLYCHMVDKEQYSKPISNKEKTDHPCWTTDMLPPLVSMVNHRHHMETQYFIAMVRDGKDGKAPLKGTAIIPLKPMVQSFGEFVHFAVDIEFRSKIIGSMSGQLKLVDL